MIMTTKMITTVMMTHLDDHGVRWTISSSAFAQRRLRCSGFVSSVPLKCPRCGHTSPVLDDVCLQTRLRSFEASPVSHHIRIAPCRIERLGPVSL